MSRKRTFTDSQFLSAVVESRSIRQVLNKLNLSATGANYKTVHRLVTELQCDTSHWTGRGYLKNLTHNWTPKIPFEEILIEDSQYRGSTSFLKKRLLKAGLIENKCQICNMEPEWNGKPLTLILDHINGKNNDNRISNLRLVCPNCGSQLNTFAGRNRKK